MNSTLLLAGVALVSGCAVSIGYTPTNAPPHALVRKEPQQVEIHTVQPNDRQFVDVGVFEATIDNVGDDQDKVISKIRKEAAARGCDSLVVEAPRPALVVIGPSADMLYRATCIVYK